MTSTKNVLLKLTGEYDENIKSREKAIHLTEGTFSRLAALVALYRLWSRPWPGIAGNKFVNDWKSTRMNSNNTHCVIRLSNKLLPKSSDIDIWRQVTE